MIQEAASADKFAPHENVASNRWIVAKGAVLINCLDSRFLGICATSDRAGLVIHEVGGRVRQNNAGDDLHKCRFSCPVFAEQSDNFIVPNAKITTVKGFLRSVALADVGGAEQPFSVFHFNSSSSRRRH